MLAVDEAQEAIRRIQWREVRPLLGKEARCWNAFAAHESLKDLRAEWLKLAESIFRHRQSPVPDDFVQARQRILQAVESLLRKSIDGIIIDALAE